MPEKVITAGIGAGSSLVSGLIGKSAADKAARNQATATQNAMAAEEERRRAEQAELDRRWQAEQEERRYDRQRREQRDRLLMGLAQRYGFKPGGVNLGALAQMGRGARAPMNAASQAPGMMERG